MKKGPLFMICSLVLGALLVSGTSFADEKGQHGSMSGMHGEGKMEGHGMMKMGDKVFEGEIGPWTGEIRLVDMKAQMARMKGSEKMMANMKNTHHVALSLEDPKAKAPVTEGKGTVTITGPDGKQATYDVMAMQGHFGTDVVLDKPGRYVFDVRIESGGEKGTATFSEEIR